MRHDPCWRGHQTREHIGLWRVDDGWDGLWRPVDNEPLFGWGGGGPENCTDKTGCPSLEDPHLWWDKRGAHILMHYQNSPVVHKTRGAYGWSLDGLQWHLETMPLISNTSAWSMHVQWTNGSASSLGRRQRASFIRDPETNLPTHLLNGADFNSHTIPGDPSLCEGCHWGTGVSLIQPLGNSTARRRHKKRHRT